MLHIQSGEHLREIAGSNDHGYPRVYVNHGTSKCFCEQCVYKNLDLAADVIDEGGFDSNWTVFVHFEGAPMHCDNCGADIDSAYGEVENE